MHARFAEPGSDFLAFLSLWDYLRDRQRELSGSALRRMCRREYLHYLRVREWQDLYGQLRQAAAELGIVVGRDRGSLSTVDPGSPPGQAAAARDGRTRPTMIHNGVAGRGSTQLRRTLQDTEAPSPAGPRNGSAPGAAREREARFPADLADRVHISLLAGLLSHIGTKEADQKSHGKRRAQAEFAGARGARFAIFPGSALARKPPQWVVAAELVETSRLWARTAARIEPEWAEPLAAHLVKRTYSEPHWDGRRGAAMASEKVTLYGLPVVAARQVNYGRIDPAAARDLFISRALVEGDWQTRHQFFHHNRRLLEEAEDLERRARRRGIVADDAALFEFYDRRIPKDVTSARHFDTWWKKTRAADPGMLTFSPADLVTPAAQQIRPADYPSTWGKLPLSYEFAPGEPADGVSVDIPLAMLNQASGEEIGWQVPGLREELVTELIRSLPKHLRKAFVPAPDAARAAVAGLGPARGDLLDALGAELGRLGGVKIPREAWDLSRLPAHLRITFRVVDSGRVLATGKDLDALRRQLRPRMQAMLTETARGITRSGLRNWDLGSLPRVFTDGQVRAYPALADAGDAVEVRLFDTEAEASKAMWRGTRRLLLIQVPSGVRSSASRLPGNAKLAMSRSPYPGVGALLEDCAACAADQVIAEAGGPARDAEGFAHLLESARSALPSATTGVVDVVARALAEAHEIEVRLGHAASPAVAPALADIRSQLSALIYPGFVAGTGSRRLPDLVRYLRAIAQRLGKMMAHPGRDADRMAVVHRAADAYQRAVEELPASGRCGEEARAVGWMIEELRVSLFAQTLGTPAPVSEQRIQSALDHLAT